MLDGRYAALPACPANAIAEVKEAVRRASGWVAEKEFGAGVHEALRAFPQVAHLPVPGGHRAVDAAGWAWIARERPLPVPGSDGALPSNLATEA